MTPHSTYAQSLSWVAGLMCQTPVDVLDHPTPCDEFDVRALMGHLLGTAGRSLATAQLSSTRDIPHVITDVADQDLGARYARLSRDITRAWSALGQADEVITPWGRCPVSEAVRGFTVETLVHGWDLAVATGRPCEAPDGLAVSVIDHADSLIPERLRGVMYADQQTPPAGAGTTERLAYLLGHHR